MTTIATDGRTMAADTLVTAGGERVGYCDKVRRAPNGVVYACCGPSADAEKFESWLCTGGEKPILSEDFGALMLRHDGKVYHITKDLIEIEFMVPQAIGSGGDFAIGAMLAGASPEEAVAISCARDTGSGGNVTSLAVNAPKPIAA